MTTDTRATRNGHQGQAIAPPTPIQDAPAPDRPSLASLISGYIRDGNDDPDAIVEAMCETFTAAHWSDYGPTVLRPYVSDVFRRTHQFSYATPRPGPSRGKRLEAGVLSWLSGLHFAHGEWKRAGVMTIDDWLDVAASKRQLAEETLGEAERAEAIAALMRKRKAQTTGDLPAGEIDKVLR